MKCSIRTFQFYSLVDNKGFTVNRNPETLSAFIKTTSLTFEAKNNLKNRKYNLKA